MIRLSDIPEWLIPISDDPRTVWQWRLRLALVACSAWLLVVGFMLPALFVGLPMLGQVAWSSDVEEHIETTVRSTVQPLKTDIEELRKEVSEQTSAANSVLAEFTYASLMETAHRFCKATGTERQRLYRELRLKKLRYRQYSGDSGFEPPGCADL